MILEALVTTVDPDGSMHVAPMGPRVMPDWSGFLLRPFPTSQTWRNLQARRAGVVHVTDDVLLLARAAVGQAGRPPCRPAQAVPGFVLQDSCRFYEFTVTEVDESQERIHVWTRVVHAGTQREFFGLNRAKHAVVEAAILATRLHLIPIDDVRADLARLRPLVEKTGGSAEREAFAFLESYIAAWSGGASS